MNGGQVAATTTITFVVAQASTERLQQLLAQLDYLPLSFAPTAPLSSPAEAVTVQAGTFAWRWPGAPPSLTSLWTEGDEDVITKGAVMTFENQNGLSVDGLAGRQVWASLLSDLSAGKVDTTPYTYVLVSKQLPETLTLYTNGAPTMAGIPVNTGAPGADTVDGTYPVFEHVTSSRMQGTNPDGSTYDDPNVPWASFFNGGDALHGFVRATYGSPQSNGCVEMSIANAAQVWPLTPIGTLVTVVGPAILRRRAAVAAVVGRPLPLVPCPAAELTYRNGFGFDLAPDRLWDRIEQVDQFERWWPWLSDCHLQGNGSGAGLGAVRGGQATTPVPDGGAHRPGRLRASARHRRNGERRPGRGGRTADASGAGRDLGRGGLDGGGAAAGHAAGRPDRSSVAAVGSRPGGRDDRRRVPPPDSRTVTRRGCSPPSTTAPPWVIGIAALSDRSMTGHPAIAT